MGLQYLGDSLAGSRGTNLHKTLQLIVNEDVARYGNVAVEESG